MTSHREDHSWNEQDSITPPTLATPDEESITGPSTASVAVKSPPPGNTPEPVAAATPDPDQGIGRFYSHDSAAAGPALQPSRPRHILDANGPLRGRTVVVVGCGSVGLWVAYSYALAGARVIVLDDGLFNTYDVAAGWLQEYHSTDRRAGRMNTEALRIWQTLAKETLPEGAVTWEPLLMERTARAARFSKENTALPDFTPVQKPAPGVAEAFTASTLVAPAQLWRPELLRTLAALQSVTLEARHIRDREEMSSLAAEYGADFVVNCTGIATAAMYDDHEFTHNFGLVVYASMPDGWTGGVRSRDLGETHIGFGIPGATSDPYLITQRSLRRIVIGGVMWPMTMRRATDLVENDYLVEEVIADEVFHRAVRHFPEISGLERIGAACSVRPSRTSFLLDFDRDSPLLLHLNGFGGAGVTLAPVAARYSLAAIVDAIQRGSTGC